MCNQCNDAKQEHVHAVPSRREVLRAGAALVAAPFLVGCPTHARAGKIQGTATEWLSYGGDKASSKYAPLAQIGSDNFNRLQVAWTWRSADEEVGNANPQLKTWVWEATPLMAGGVLYVSTSLSQVAAIDAATGKTRWVYDPETWKGGTPSNDHEPINDHDGASAAQVARTVCWSARADGDDAGSASLEAALYGRITAIDLNTGNHRALRLP
jgi:glucose dehydrogenase